MSIWTFAEIPALDIWHDELSFASNSPREDTCTSEAVLVKKPEPLKNGERVKSLALAFWGVFDGHA
jgi:hypothetical protein